MQPDHRIGYAVVGGVSFLVPLAIVPTSFSFNFDSLPKQACFLFALALLLLAPGLWGRVVSGLWTSRPGRLLLLFAALETSSLLVSTLLSSDPELSLFGTRWRYFGALTQVSVLLWIVAAAALCRSRFLLSAALTSMSAAGALVALYVIMQYFGVDPLLDTRIYSSLASGQLLRPPGSLGHAGYMAGYEAAAFLIAAGLASFETRKWWRVGLTTAAALALTAVLLSGTRAALLAVAVGLVILLAGKGSQLARARLAVVLLVPAAAVAVVAALPQGQPIRDRIQQWGVDLAGGTRLPMWRDALQLVSARPTFGSGPETFVAVFPRVQSADLWRRYPDSQQESAHNILLDALVSQGVFGVAWMLARFGLAWRCFQRAAPADQPLANVLFAALVSCFLFHQFFVLTLPNATAIGFFTAALVALAQPPASESGPQAVRRQPITTFVATIAGIIVLAVLIQLTAIDYAFAQVDHRLSRGDLAGAVDAYRIENSVHLFAHQPDLWYSQQMSAAERMLPPGPSQTLANSEADAASAAAAQHPGEDRLMALYNKLVLSARAGRIPDADAVAEQLVAAAPNWYQGHWAVSRLRLQQGRLEEARREAESAISLAGDRKPEFQQEVRQFLDLLPALGRAAR